MRQILEAVGFMHSMGVVHRDLKVFCLIIPLWRLPVFSLNFMWMDC